MMALFPLECRVAPLLMIAGNLECCDEEKSLVWRMVAVRYGPKKGRRERQRDRESYCEDRRLMDVK
jgi:hypothetical protein